MSTILPQVDFARPPIVFAVILVLNSHGQVLLVQHGYENREYALPGGHIEPEESPHETVMREVAEETGLSIQVERVLALYSYAILPPCHALVFLGTVIGGEIRLPPDGEILHAGWFDAGALPQPVLPTVLYALEDARAKNYGVIRTVPIQRQ